LRCTNISAINRKKTHYKPRQDFANQRIRIKGRFVKIDKDKPLTPEILAAIAKQKAKQEEYKKTREGKYRRLTYT
jgi:hypothetical protein